MPFKMLLKAMFLSCICTAGSVFAQVSLPATKSVKIPPITKAPTYDISRQKEAYKNVNESKFPTIDKKTIADTILKELKTTRPNILMKSGGVDTGGGTLVKTHQGIGLLDLYLYNKSAFSDRRMNNGLLYSRSLKSLGVDLISNQNQPIFQKTLEQIDKWSTSSPIMTRYLKLAIRNLRIYFHQGTFSMSPLEYYLPDQSGVNTEDLKMIAIYIKGFGVHVGIDDFKNLPETHQIALLIHEGIRAMSISGDFNYSNETIQKLTAILISTPKPDQSLDREYFLNIQAISGIQNYTSLIQEVQDLKNEICSGNYAIKYNDCNVREKDLTIESARHIAEDIFSKLNILPKNKNTSDLLYRAYIAVTRFENNSYSELNSEARLLTLRSRLTMLLDSFIDIENNKGLPARSVAEVKYALRAYFKSIGIDQKDTVD